MKKLFFAFIFILLSTGCTTIRKQALDPRAAASIKGQSLAVTTYQTPDFTAMTPAKVLIPFGAFAMVSEGNKIIAENKVNDPSLKISADLASHLEEQLGVQLLARPIAVNDDDIHKIVDAAGASTHYVLDVKTFMWGMSYFSTDWTHYHVIHTARARLIDSKSKTVLAEGFCTRPSPSNTNAPTYDELVANNATLLKQESLNASETCIANLKMEMLAHTQGAQAGLAPKPTSSNAQLEAKPVTSTQSASAATTPIATSYPIDGNVKQESSLSSEKPSEPLPTSAEINPSAYKSSAKIQTVEFQIGASSFSVEKLANKAGCFSDKGAGIITEKGPIEAYRVKCNDGKTFVARCELRQCKALR
jgi:hypothetical protein